MYMHACYLDAVQTRDAGTFIYVHVIEKRGTLCRHVCGWMLACYADLIQTRQRGEMYVTLYPDTGLALWGYLRTIVCTCGIGKAHALPDLSREVVLPKGTESCGHLDIMVCMEKSPWLPFLFIPIEAGWPAQADVSHSNQQPAPLSTGQLWCRFPFWR